VQHNSVAGVSETPVVVFKFMLPRNPNIRRDRIGEPVSVGLSDCHVAPQYRDLIDRSQSHATQAAWTEC